MAQGRSKSDGEEAAGRGRTMEAGGVGCPDGVTGVVERGGFEGCARREMGVGLLGLRRCVLAALKGSERERTRGHRDREEGSCGTRGGDRARRCGDGHGNERERWDRAELSPALGLEGARLGLGPA